MNFIFMAVSLVCFVAAIILSKKSSEEKGLKIIKGASLALFAIFALRCLSYTSQLDKYTLVLKSYSELISPAVGNVQAFFAFVFEWLSVMAVMLLACKPYFKVRVADRLVLFVLPIYCILALVSLGWVAEISLKAGINKITFPTVLTFMEVGGTCALVGYYWVQAIKQKNIPAIKGWKDVGGFILAVFIALFISLPNYWISFLFGDINLTVAEIKSFRESHRFLIYGGIILPIIAYFALRRFPKEFVRFALTFFSLTAMFVYCYDVTFAKIVQDPTSWPLHLCNTAMFLVPLCLVFKVQKLFYFTYFINVFGALIAMLMPNYNETQMLFSSNTLQFWYNHYCAFFMPLLLVALKLFDRPTVKQYRYSIIGFVMYFLFALIINVILRAFGHETDYFFLVGDHVASTLGTWAEKIYDISVGFTIVGHEFLFRPVYQVLFFIVYIGLGLAVWFVYEIFFTLTDAHGAMTERRKKIKIDQLALAATLNGRSIDEPMNKDAGIKLELKHFSKKYATSKIYAVNDANLEVRGGEIFGFLGPNGAGKSTIIKSIVGIQPITEGSIEVCGYDCEKQSVQAKRLIGYVPDHYALYEKLTGREYINYIADIYDVSHEDRTARIERHIEMFELQGAIDNPIKTYSHGMKQKITIMAALVHDPKLWILDEPLTGLDPNSIHQVKECMKEHAAKGNIVFFSSHIIDVVERICDRITIIKKGKILVTKDVAEIEKEGLLEEYYLKMINGESAAE